MRNDDDFKKYKEKAFQNYCYKVIDSGAKDFYRKRKVRAKKYEIVSLDSLTDKQLYELYSPEDLYRDYIFDVWGAEVVVKDKGDIVDALLTLSERERNIVLASIYLGYTDSEIAKKISTPRRTVAWRRLKILNKLKMFMLEEMENEKE